VKLKNTPKPLTINDVVYAHYFIEGGVLYLKVRKDIISKKRKESEGFIIQLISLIERRKLFEYMSYLNIK